MKPPRRDPLLCGSRTSGEEEEFRFDVIDVDDDGGIADDIPATWRRWPASLSLLPNPVHMSRKVAAALFILTCFDSLVIWVHCASKTQVEQHLQKGMQLIAAGQYSDALSHFHSAIDADPSDYMSYYKRATVFLALSRARPALADLDKVIELKPDFLQARVKRGSVLLKLGRLDEAHIDFENVLARDPGNDEAAQLYLQVEPVRQTYEEAEDLHKVQSYQLMVNKIDEIIEQVPWDPHLREMRAEGYMGEGNTIHAISDLKTMTRLTSDNTDGFFKLSQLHYQLGETEESLMDVRECLKLDPEHKDCYPFYKSVKKVAKFAGEAQEAQNAQNWGECVEAARKILKNEKKVQRVRFHGHDKLCHCQLKSGVSDLARVRTSCNEALNIIEEPRIYCDRADAFLADDMYDEAVKDFRRALELDEGFQRAKEGLESAQKRQKMASKRDYYKILGVRRNANKRDVTKAYRKLAQQWHPDNFQDEEEKKKAEKKFMDIAAAKEVLSDQEMRRKFDSGEDPLDPEDQQRANNPFQGHPHFHTFTGGQSFKFHFS